MDSHYLDLSLPIYIGMQIFLIARSFVKRHLGFEIEVNDRLARRPNEEKWKSAQSYTSGSHTEIQPLDKVRVAIAEVMKAENRDR